MDRQHHDTLRTECTRLWNEVFGDSNEFISAFMDNHYAESNMLYIESCDRLLSMLHLIPFELCETRVAYIYAVATDCNARGKGYATQLINKAIQKAKNEGYKAVITLPADSRLTEFYARFGFRGRFATVFDSPDKFDFGTGKKDDDFTMILPLDNDFPTPTENDKIILKKTGLSLF